MTFDRMRTSEPSTVTITFVTWWATGWSWVSSIIRRISAEPTTCRSVGPNPRSS